MRGRTDWRRLLQIAVALAGLSASPASADDIRFHQPSALGAPETLFGIAASGLADQIEQALAEETGFANLQSFTVHWDRPTFRCLIKTYELHDGEHGVCLVDVGAFQIAATAMIIKDGKANSFKVSILDAMIE